MWKLVIILMFIGVKIKGEDEEEEENECGDCNFVIETCLYTLEHTLRFDEPIEPLRSFVKRSIPDCEYCELRNLTNFARNGDSCLTEKEGCAEQISHIVLDSTYINCSCELNTKSGKKTGGIHGYIEKPMFSIRIISCSKPMGIPHFYEDGHIGADKLHVTCYGDEEFTKACEEKEHLYNVDNVVTAVGNSIVDTINSRYRSGVKDFDCR